MGDDKIFRITGAAAQAIYDHLLSEGIKPHAEIFEPIIMGGDVAVVMFNPGADALELAPRLGWDGKAPAFRMPSGARKRYANLIEMTGDAVSAKWLRAHRRGRIFVMTERATFLVNY